MKHKMGDGYKYGGQRSDKADKFDPMSGSDSFTRVNKPAVKTKDLKSILK